MKQTLTKREKQVLKLLLAEYSQKEISRLLKLSYSRVNDIKSTIKDKWEVDTMVGLVKEGIKQGYLEIEDDTFEVPIFAPVESNRVRIVYDYTE